MSQPWIFTFGNGQRLRSTNDRSVASHPLDGEPGIGFRLDNRYVVIDADYAEARALMFAIFGQVWSFEYEAGPKTDDMITEYDLLALDIYEPLHEISQDLDNPLAAAALRLMARRPT